jgi:hypothetical protein
MARPYSVAREHPVDRPAGVDSAKRPERFFSTLGLKVSRRDRLEEQIPGDYLQSPYLPRVYRQSLARIMYVRHMFERVKPMPGDIVECGVSIGAGILYWALLCELMATPRTIYGFDSFVGFPPSGEADRKADNAFYTRAGDRASPPELVLKVLEDGRVSAEFINQHIRLVRGFFDKSLQQYDGSIALLHLGCDLYESLHTCLAQPYSMVSLGGIVLFDEHNDSNFPGARRAVDEFFCNKPEKTMPYDGFRYVKYYVVKT